MIRTLISLPEEDKAWLENYSHAKHKSVAAVIRSAIKQYKVIVGEEENDSLLAETSGLWKNRDEDGLHYVSRLRGEWE